MPGTSEGRTPQRASQESWLPSWRGARHAAEAS
ncbi:hypothetical protein BJ973_006152 [Actinoplanes tereljensis]